MKKFLSGLLIASSLVSIAKGQALSPKNGGGPIEVTADALKLLQAENRAIFTGNVKATQGTTALYAEKMTVFYSKEKTADISGQASSISKIAAEQNVKIITPTESAEGDSGTYDVKAAKITLTGDVTLKQKENILHGNKAIYDLNTGRSEIFGAAAENDGTKESGGRVRGVFVPEKKE